LFNYIARETAMTIFLTFIHLVVCMVLIGVVLLQAGKGAEMGASFGAGGSQSAFGAGGGDNFMARITTGAAIIFMLTSLTLAFLSSRPDSGSIMKGQAQPAQKAAPQNPAAPGALPAAPGQPAAPMGAQPAAPQPVPAAPAK
jgi:preprotein translocase subunit SecG